MKTCSSPETCSHLVLNSDRTYVCTLTGKCFSQMVCTPYSNFNTCSKDYKQEYKENFEQLSRKSQQIKNINLDTKTTLKTLNKLSIDFPLPREKTDLLTAQIITLWNDIVKSDYVQYIFRVDKESVVVAVLYSLHRGLCNDKKVFIINSHPELKPKGGTKRKLNSGIPMAHIRRGQNLIRRAFQGEEVIYHKINLL